MLFRIGFNKYYIFEWLINTFQALDAKIRTAILLIKNILFRIRRI